ncbi:MAG: hypothetical protein AAGA56_17435, partial [Myxococcota bacterium]
TWNVVQRRGTIRRPARTLKEEAAAIRRLIGARRLQEDRDSLLQRLREQHLSAFEPTRLGAVILKIDPDQIAPRGASSASGHRAADPTPPQGVPTELR